MIVEDVKSLGGATASVFPFENEQWSTEAVLRLWYFLDGSKYMYPLVN